VQGRYFYGQIARAREPPPASRGFLEQPVRWRQVTGAKLAPAGEGRAQAEAEARAAAGSQEPQQ
jgi:hypothetical protein